MKQKTGVITDSQKLFAVDKCCRKSMLLIILIQLNSRLKSLGKSVIFLF